MIILQNEEDFARYQRRLCPDLPDNIVEDEEIRLRFLETGKAICTDLQFTRQMIRAARKMSAEEKQKVREKLRWYIYDRFLKDTIH